MISIVLDTNVLVSAVITPFGSPARILDSILRGNITLLFDDRIMIEYRQILKRKKFNLDNELVDDILGYIETIGKHVIAPPFKIKVKDDSDLPFIETAIAGPADALVTGNKKHFPHKILSVQVLTPADFIKSYL